MRRILSVLAAPAVLVLLAGCGLTGGGGEPTAAPSPSPTDSVSPTTSSSPSPSALPTPTESESASTSSAAPSPSSAEATSVSPSASAETPSPSTSPTPAPTTQAAPAPTAIEHIWVDDSWTVEHLDDDPCASGMASMSPYSDRGEFFLCGPTAANLEACTFTDEQTAEVLCITNAVDRRAVSFSSPTVYSEGVTDQDVAEGVFPLYVTLADGATCAPISHDHDRHWNDKFSWYRCDDGSELLTDEDMQGTFATGDTWTVQRSVDMGEPVETPVKSAVFAGR